jgi:hypothetical protein
VRDAIIRVVAMNADLPIRIILVDPPAGVDFGVQRGRGHEYETLQVQQRTRGDIVFDFSLTVNDSRKDGLPNFTGPFAQGPADGRFLYLDVGTYAGQKDTPWSRRIKIPLKDISWTLVKRVTAKSGLFLVAKIPGKGKDGSPSCATVRLLGDWGVAKETAVVKSTTASSGYSSTPLAGKLGLAPGKTLLTLGAPSNYANLIGPTIGELKREKSLGANVDIVHMFTASRSRLATALLDCRRQLRADAVVWVSWPKKASGVQTDITEDTIREIALPLGFVDIKVCAVDATWSGLKLMVRKDLR